MGPRLLVACLYLTLLTRVAVLAGKKAKFVEKAKLRSNYKRLRVREGIDDHGPRHAVVREGSGSDSDSGQDNDGEEAEREEDDDEEEVGFAAPVAAAPAKGKPRGPVSEHLPRPGAGAAAQGAAAGGKHHGGGAGRGAGRSVGVRGESAVATEDDGCVGFSFGTAVGGRGQTTHNHTSSCFMWL
jgi:hypothetical protein